MIQFMIANTITIGDKQHALADGLVADQTNWLIDPPQGTLLPCEIKIRYNSPPVPGSIQATADRNLQVQFDDPQHAVTPGQAVVCYQGERVVCGGWISKALNRN